MSCFKNMDHFRRVLERAQKRGDEPPRREFRFNEAVALVVDPDHLAEEYDQEDHQCYARLLVQGYRLWDGTEEQFQRQGPRYHHIVQPCASGEVEIENGLGQCKTLSLSEYLDLVGLDEEFANFPGTVDWQSYQRELDEWYDRYMEEDEMEEDDSP